MRAMDLMMLVSIVIPTYNGQRYLDCTLQSVQAQTLRDWELVAVDDGSSDCTVEIARDYAAGDGRIRVVEHSHGGQAAARNRGIAEMSAGSRYAAFLDHDDVWRPDALERLARILDARPECPVAYGLATCIGADGLPGDQGEKEEFQRDRQGVVGTRLVQWPAEAPTTVAVLAFRNRIVTPGQALIRRSVLEKVGPFDTAATPIDDWDMWLRLAEEGPLAFEPTVVLGWRLHQHNDSHHTLKMGRRSHYVRCKHMRSLAFTSEHRRAAARGYLCDCRERFRYAMACYGHRPLSDVLREFRRAAVATGRYMAGRYLG
jgi:glycosyltransferase involved in cell wall biosynthesis